MPRGRGRVEPVNSLELFSAPVREWFVNSFGDPTDAQEQTWPAIARGDHTLLCAPTGSGKTLAAFLYAIDRLSTQPLSSEDKPLTSVVYISPLRALAVDVEKNLRAPLRGSMLAAQRLGCVFREPTVGVRTGDTSAKERRSLIAHPPDILITTPESLYLMLTSAARETLTAVQTVIIDEIHAVAATKRGSHLALSLERLHRWCDTAPQRIGLSATQRPLSEIAEFLGGFDTSTAGEPSARPVTIVESIVDKTLDLSVIVPVEDMADPAVPTTAGADRPSPNNTPTQRSIWPAIHAPLAELIQQHRSTIVFVNARRGAERLATRLNEYVLEGKLRAAENDGTSPETGAEVVKAHHGSLSRTQRLNIEDELKTGALKGLVATSSLELGIDMGAVDLVIQVESPRSVAAGMQRVGRAGHQVGAVSRGVFFPKHRMDLLETAVVIEAMEHRRVESTRYIRNPLDVLSQQLVAMVALDDWQVDDVFDVIRSSAPFAALGREVFLATLEMLDGRYPSDEFAELRPRLVWDRLSHTLTARSGAQRLAVTNAGTIPDRGLFSVVLPDGKRVGELDEEMVYESRVGETFLLGATTWRIEEITVNNVVVTPAPGMPGKMPFWHGDGLGRPAELGRAIGAFVTKIRALPAPAAIELLKADHHLNDWAANNLVKFLDEQFEAVGAVPDARTIVVERFRDEIGDWRVCILSPYGSRVHAPWALAIRRSLELAGTDDLDIMWGDDGIIFRLPDGMDELDVEVLFPSADDAHDRVIEALGSSAMFASRFREAAGRALLLPRRRMDQRTPLWQQRQRAASLLSVASKYPSFPILLETTRECLHDVFDMDALADVLQSVSRREIRVVTADTTTPSPFSQSMLFDWVAVYMYEGDAPLAERKAGALNLDPTLLRELLGTDELRSLLSQDSIDAVTAQLQFLVDERKVHGEDNLHDVLRTLGPLSVDELLRRSTDAPDVVRTYVAHLIEQRRAIEIAIGDSTLVADASDAGRLRDALGVAIPMGLPMAFVEPIDDPLMGLVRRFARTNGPFGLEDLLEVFPARPSELERCLAELCASGSLVRGAFRPSGTTTEWCDAEVLRRIRKSTLVALRSEIAAVERSDLAQFLMEWHGLTQARQGQAALIDAVELLDGAPIAASVVEADVLPARIDGYSPVFLDQLLSSGDVVWTGIESIGAKDGRLRLTKRSSAGLWVGDVAEREQAALSAGGASGAIIGLLRDERSAFWPDFVRACADAEVPCDDVTVSEALWDLVWSGLVSSDSFGAVRAFVGSGAAGRTSKRSAAGRPRVGARSFRSLRASGPPTAAGRWWLVSQLAVPPADPVEIAERTLARAAILLERYGVFTREMALAEGIAAGFAGLYPVLGELETHGEVRRGYFVEGLGAAQFGVPQAVERLRAVARRDKTTDRPLVVAATDPAQPYGAVLPWPDSTQRVTRSAGARVVLCGGELIAWFDRSLRQVVTFGETQLWIEALTEFALSRPHHAVELTKVDGEPVASSVCADQLREAGFVDSYRGLRFRPRVPNR